MNKNKGDWIFTRMIVCNYAWKLNCEPQITKTPKGKSTGLPSPLDLSEEFGKEGWSKDEQT